MRDWILGAAILISGLALTWAISRDTDRSRYVLASSGDVVAVLDTLTGQVQTFGKAGDAKYFTYVGADSRRAALERTQQPAK